MRSLVRSLCFLAAGVLLTLTESRVTWLDDEVKIYETAQEPVRNTILKFTSGDGQHEHPPLSDIVLHDWIALIGPRLWALRIPDIAAFCLGGWVLSRAALMAAGEGAADMVAGLFLIWPFGYHFGRMFGWYAVSFLEVAAVGYCVVRFARNPVKGRSFVCWTAALALTGAALVYTNYFGWALLGAAAVLQFWLMKEKAAAARSIVLWVAFCVIAYLPLWPAFFKQVSTANPFAARTAAQIAYLGYSAQCLLVGETVAPWSGSLGALCAIGTALLWLVGLFQNSRVGRGFFTAGSAMLLAMAAGGILGAKRLIIVAPWLLLGWACSLSSLRPALRTAALASIAAVFALGWFGIVTQRYYGALHAIEPWQRYARAAAARVGEGWVVLGNSPVFFFYLQFETPQINARARAVTEFTGSWAASNRVQFVDGVNRDREQESLVALTWLKANCQPLREQADIEDAGFRLKEKFFPSAGQRQYRIIVHEFDCR